jgi:hypothetical protein
MKDELLKVYQNRQADFINIMAQFPGKLNGHGPLLISPKEIYTTQQNPLLIVGQSTNEWDSNVEDIPKQMEVYEDFNLGKDQGNDPFWSVVRKVEKALGNEYYSCAWTNINKFDIGGENPSGEYATAIATLDDILVPEIKILKPKICIFLTGPDFDGRIKKIFPEIEFTEVEGYPIRQLSRLKHPDFPVLSFRTYHPGYLRRGKLEDGFIEFVKGIKDL